MGGPEIIRSFKTMLLKRVEQPVIDGQAYDPLEARRAAFKRRFPDGRSEGALPAEKIMRYNDTYLVLRKIPETPEE